MNKPLPSTIFNGPNPAGKDKNRHWFEFKNEASSNTAEIRIYDDIGRDYFDDTGISGEDFVDELEKIPKDRDILLRIHSRGGNVFDALLMYHRLKERRDHLTAQIDGLAASAASFVAMAAGEVRMPKAGRFMIHDASALAFGNSDAMHELAKRLDAESDNIALIYAEKTKKSQSDIRAMMRKTTWMNGAEAQANGFADTVTDEAILNAHFDLSHFPNVPDELLLSRNSSALIEEYKAGWRTLEAICGELGAAANTTTKNTGSTQWISAASGGDNKKQGDTMNREKLLALLTELGVTVKDAATDEELLAALKNAWAEQKKKPATAPDTIPSDDPEAAPVNRLKDLEAGFNRLTSHLEEEKKLRQQERKQRIERVVDECIAEDRLPAASREKWLTVALADESILDELQKFPPRPPGADPVSGVVITGESPKDIERGLLKLRDPLASWLKGNSVEPFKIADNAKRMALEITNHRKKLDAILNANTVSTDLKRNVILNDLMRAFKRRLLMLRVLTTQFNNVPLEGNNKVTVPFYDLDTTASSNFVAATGYEFAEDTEVTSRTITIDKRKYKSMNFSSDTFRRQPYFSPEQSLIMKVEQLGVDVWTDILSVVTRSNYGSPIANVEAAAFDSDEIVDLRKEANDADWPDIGRACVLSTDHEAALLKDDDVKSALHSGSDRALREGATGRLFGFDMYFSPRIPTNSEDLAGFICLPQAALVATAPIAPAPGVRNRLLSYELVVDPDTGLAFEYRYWDDADKDKDREIVEVNYGYAKGNGGALKIITAGAAEFSSSSSASSVNSSSSSSSSASF